MKSIQRKHSASDGTVYLIDDTERHRILVFEKKFIGGGTPYYRKTQSAAFSLRAKVYADRKYPVRILRRNPPAHLLCQKPCDGKSEPC